MLACSVVVMVGVMVNSKKTKAQASNQRPLEEWNILREGGYSDVAGTLWIAPRFEGRTNGEIILIKNLYIGGHFHFTSNLNDVQIQVWQEPVVVKTMNRYMPWTITFKPK